MSPVVVAQRLERGGRHVVRVVVELDERRVGRRRQAQVLAVRDARQPRGAGRRRARALRLSLLLS